MRFNRILMGIGLPLVFAALVLVAGEGRAAPLNLTPTTPNIGSPVQVDVAYNAGTQTFAAFGGASAFDDGVLTSPIAGGVLNIAAAVDNAGNASGGSLTINGTVAALGFNSGTLLTGTLSAFGFGIAGPLEFLFNVTGGDAAGLYGATAGVILSNTGFAGGFASSFGTGGSFSASGDTFAVATAVPEPSSLSLFLLGLCLCGVVLSWRRRSTIAIG